MTVDPIEHYGVSPRIAKAAMTVLENIAAREGSALPSDAVIGKALTILGDDSYPPKVSRRIPPAVVYKVQSATQPHCLHFVALYFGSVYADFGKRIIDAECSCEATTACSHLLVALTLAERDGYSLETSKTDDGSQTAKKGKYVHQRGCSAGPDPCTCDLPFPKLKRSKP